jgi:hypothetical protein
MRDSNQYNIGGISSSQKGVDNLVPGAERVSMKAIIPLAVLAMVGSCFAAPGFEQKDLDRDLAKAQATSDRLQSSQTLHGWEAAKADPSAYQSSKVDYTIVTLPSGKTATALTFK